MKDYIRNSYTYIIYFYTFIYICISYTIDKLYNTCTIVVLHTYDSILTIIQKYLAYCKTYAYDKIVEITRL